MLSHIIDHWKETWPQVSAEHSPYDHTYLEGFFPDDVYDEILLKFPSPQDYQPLNSKRYARADGQSTRDILTLNGEGIAHLDKPLKSFWGELGEALTSGAIKRLVFEKLKHDVALRLNISPDEAVDAEAFISVLLIRDTEEYRIKPHPDGFPRLVTMMLYLPRDFSQENLGTSVYVREPAYKRLVGKKFREVKRFPFRPNSAAAFAVNNLPHRQSLHGRELIEAGAGERNVMIVTWFSEPPRDEKSQKFLAEPVHERVA